MFGSVVTRLWRNYEIKLKAWEKGGKSINQQEKKLTSIYLYIYNDNWLTATVGAAVLGLIIA